MSDIMGGREEGQTVGMTREIIIQSDHSGNHFPFSHAVELLMDIYST